MHMCVLWVCVRVGVCMCVWVQMDMVNLIAATVQQHKQFKYK